MNYPNLQGFRTTLLNRVRVSNREIDRQNKRKNYRAELDRLIALEAIVLLDDYIKRAKGNEHEETTLDLGFIFDPLLCDFYRTR